MRTRIILTLIVASIMSQLLFKMADSESVGPAPAMVIENENDSSHMTSLAFSPDGKYLATGEDYSGNVRLWDMTEGKVLWAKVFHNGELNNDVAFHPGGKYLVVAGCDNGGECSCHPCTRSTVKIISVPDGKVIKTIAPHRGAIDGFRLSPLGDVFATGTCYGKGALKIWNFKTGALIKSYSKLGECIYDMAFSGNGEFLSVSTGIKISLFNLKTKALIKTFALEGVDKEDYQSNVSSMALNNNGDTLFSNGFNGGINVWDMNSGKITRKIGAESVRYENLSLSPDEKIIMTIWDGTDSLWSLVNDQKITYFEANALRATFNQKGDIVATIGEDGSPPELTPASFDVRFSGSCLRLWSVNNQSLLLTLVPLPEGNWVVYSPQGYFDAGQKSKQFIKWEVGNETFGPEKFWDTYYRPGLFAKVMSGEITQ